MLLTDLVVSLVGIAECVLLWLVKGHIPLLGLVNGAVLQLPIMHPLLMVGNETIVDVRGITLRRRFRGEASFSWRDVKSIDIADRPGVVIKITRRSGGSVALPAPISYPGMTDRTVLDSAQEVRRYARVNGWRV